MRDVLRRPTAFRARGGAWTHRPRPAPLFCRASSHYDVLGVTPQASPIDIKKAFRTLALKLHPDVNQEAAAAKQFIKVKEAYEVLSDPSAREAYDQQFRGPGHRPTSFSGYNPSQSPWASTSNADSALDEDLAWIFQNAGLPIEVVEMFVDFEDLENARSSSVFGTYRSSGGESTSGRTSGHCAGSSGSSSSSRRRGSSSVKSSSGGGSSAGRGASRSRGGQSTRQQAGPPLAFDMFVAELNEDMRQCLVSELLELPEWERGVLLQDLQSAETTTEVRSLLADALGVGATSDRDDDEYAGYYEVLSRGHWSPWEVDALEAMDTAAFWHKNAGSGSRPRGFRGGGSGGGGERQGRAGPHSTFTFWEEAATARGARGGQGQGRASSKRRGKADLDLGELDLHDIDDVDAYNAWVRAVGLGGSQDARRRSRRARRR